MEGPELNVHFYGGGWLRAVPVLKGQTRYIRIEIKAERGLLPERALDKLADWRREVATSWFVMQQIRDNKCRNTD